MAEQIVIEFTADISKLQPAIDALEHIGQIDKKSADIFRATNAEYQNRAKEVNKLSQAYNHLSEEVASGGMKEHANDLKKTTDEIVKQKGETENLTKKLRAMIRELALMKQEGRDNTEQFRQMSREAGKLADDIGDAREQVKVLSSDTKRLDAVATAFRGLAAGMSVATGASAMLGDENKDLQKTLLQVQSAMAVLTGVQELATIATGQNALKTMILDGAQKAVAASAEWMGKNIKAATALALGGVGLLVTGFITLVQYLNDATEETNAFKRSLNNIGETAELINKRIELIKAGLTDEINANLDAERKKRELLLEFQIKRNKDLQAANDAFNKLDSAEKIRYYGEYIRKREAIIDSYQKSEKLIILNYEREIAAIKEAEQKKSSDKQNKQRQKDIKENYDYLLEIGKDMVEAEKKMFSEIMKYQIDQMREERRMAEEQEAWMDAMIQREIDREKAAEDEKLRAKKEAMEKEKKARQELNEAIQQNAWQSAESSLNSIFELRANKREEEFNASIMMIEKEKNAVLQNDALTAEQREAIEARYEARARRLKINAWIANQKAAENEAIINTALSITKTFAQLGWPAGIPAAIAAGVAGAFQVATIRSQPMPQFAEGTEFVEGAGTGTSDSITAKLSRGERVVPARTNAEYFDALSVIQNRLIAPELVNTLLTNIAENGGMLELPADKIKSLENNSEGIDYNKLSEAMQKGRSVVNIQMNEKGFVKHIQRGLNQSTYHNTKLRLRA